MIVVYAGRRPSDDEAGLPHQNAGFLRERLTLILAGLAPRLVVGSGAAGSDLISARAARSTGADVTMVVAGDVATFRSASVADKGAEWAAAFDGLLRDDKVRLVEHGRTADDAAYAAVNAEILLTAGRESTAAERVVVVVVTGGREPGRGGPDHTEDLADAAEAAGHLVMRVDPLIARDSAPFAFVAMPFGDKPDPARAGRTWKADATWQRILLPALVCAGYRPYRVDVDPSTEIIDRKMVEAIVSADLLVADLALQNPNVMWELGVRHALSRSGTILVGPGGGAPPFDVARIPVVGYERSPARVTDRQATTSIARLIQAFRAPRGVDSPVYAALPELAPPRIEAEVTDDNAFQEFLERVSRASDLRDRDDLRALADSLPGPWSSGAADELRVQVGYALVGLDEMAAAADVLAPVAERDNTLGRTHLQERYALALVHSSTGLPDRLARATNVLRALHSRRPGSAEIAGLLGSAAKRAYEADPTGAAALAHVRAAADAYERGFASDPTDAYCGVNAVALLGALARRDGADTDARRAARLLPVLEFALDRPGAGEDPWHAFTVAETRLLKLLFASVSARPDVEDVVSAYREATRDATPQQVSSARRQIDLLASVGGTAPVLAAVAALLAVSAV